MSNFKLEFDISKTGVCLWYHKRIDGGYIITKSFSIRCYLRSWIRNKVAPHFTFRTNGARKGNKEDSCFDATLTIGYVLFNYTNWSYNTPWKTINDKAGI